MDLDPDACLRAFRSRDVRFDGHLFAGVTSTGIYCRPVCPARTVKRAHLRFFETAAAAEAAGFRACLRCRPETAPGVAVWKGSSSSVSRALALIDDGALDLGDVEALAERLGLGERQLRRLFAEHLGVSPLKVAQTRRVAIAKQLIHETDLPMSQVALAAGFGSVRRFNEVFQQLYRRPPATLRHRVASSRPLVAVQLRWRTPYDWEQLRAFLSARAIVGVEAVEGDSYARSISLGGACGTLKVSPLRGDALEVEVRFPRLDALPAILARVRRLFDLSADPASIGEHLAQDPLLAPLVTARPGLRVPGAWDAFELAVRAVLGQQITVAAAVRLAGQLVATCGKPLPALQRTERLTTVFPSAASMAASNLEFLGMPASRRRNLRALAQALVENPALFAPRRGLDEAIARLKGLSGIGEWTAQYIAMRELREPDAFPAADVGLMRAIEQLEGRRPTAAELLARAERWRPWRGYAAVHLWASLVDASAAPVSQRKERRRDHAA